MQAWGAPFKILVLRMSAYPKDKLIIEYIINVQIRIKHAKRLPETPKNIETKIGLIDYVIDN